MPSLTHRGGMARPHYKAPFGGWKVLRKGMKVIDDLTGSRFYEHDAASQYGLTLDSSKPRRLDRKYGGRADKQ